MSDYGESIDLALELGEDRGRRLIEGLGVRAACREFDRQCAIRYSLHLLRNGAKRPEIRDRLMQRYGIERRAAYMRIDEALQIRYRPQVCMNTANPCTELAPTDDSDMEAKR